MLFGADTKKFFPLKILDGAGMKKALLTLYVRQGWHEKGLSTENAGPGIKLSDLGLQITNYFLYVLNQTQYFFSFSTNRI